MSDKKEWRETYMSADLTHGCESCGEDFVNSVIEKSCPVCGKETVVLFNQKYIDSIKEKYESEKQRADRLEKENQKLKEALVKISKDDGYWGWRYEDIFKDHQKIAKEALK